MATVNVVLASSDTDSRRGGSPLPVVKSVPKGSATLASSTSNQVVTLVPAGVPQALNDIWIVTASGGAVMFRAGAAATATRDYRILDGQTRYFGVTADGESANIIDA